MTIDRLSSIADIYIDDISFGTLLIKKNLAVKYQEKIKVVLIYKFHVFIRAELLNSKKVIDVKQINQKLSSSLTICKQFILSFLFRF
jgi:hypothetical protein